MEYSILIPLAVLATVIGGSIILLILLALVALWADWTADFKEPEWHGFSYDYPYNPKKVIFNWTAFAILIILLTGFLPGNLQ